MNEMKYEELRPALKTGDIVLFSGKGFISRMIKLFTRSKWSHVGMVVVARDIDSVLLFQSTTLSKSRDITGKERKGVQLNYLSDVVTKYNGDIAIRCLNMTPEDLQKVEAITSTVRKEFYGRDYEDKYGELLMSAVDIIGENKTNLDTLFCSELCAEVFVRAGKLAAPSNEYTPADFGNMLHLWLRDKVLIRRK